LLVASGVLGVVLAVHGYGAGAGVASGVVSPVTRTAGPVATTGANAGRHHPAQGTHPASHSTTTTTPTAPGRTSQKLGPPLSSSAYAHYAYQLYPAPSSQASAATAGFSVKVTPGSGSFSLSVSAVGTSAAPQTSTYPTGDRVYFVETTLGDDSNNSDYNFGDDGVVITDAKGRIVQ
jgi:hypothetical protein